MIPIILPIEEDEDLTGWVIRMAESTCMTQTDFLHYFFGYELHTRNSRCHYISNLVSTCDQNKELPSVDQLIKKHTDIQVKELFLTTYDMSIYMDAVMFHPDYLKSKVYIRSLSRSKFHYCPKCVTQDVQDLGYPILHVPHQIPGVSACYKHGVRLVDNEEQTICQEAKNHEIRTARFAYDLYKSPIMSNVKNLMRLIIHDYDDHKISELDAEIMEYIGMGTLQEIRTKFSYSYKVGDVSKMLRLISSLYQYTELVDRISYINITEEAYKKYITTNKEDDVLTWHPPYITSVCGKCNESYSLHSSSMLMGGGCPRCYSEMGQVDYVKRRLKSVLPDYALLSVQNNILKVRHECGEVTTVSLRKVFEQQKAICPCCDLPYVYKQYKVGDEQVMKNGKKCKIVSFDPSGNSVTVQFSDGKIIRDIPYTLFSSRHVPYNKKADLAKERIGEIRTMNNGMRATIIQYCSAIDITVKFENGIVREHVAYSAFCKGNILPATRLDKKSRVEGRKKVMKNGMLAELLIYNDENDIVVKFEDGTIREHLTYHSFCHGNAVPVTKNRYQSRVGEVRRMNNGLNAKIIIYNSENNITVEFEDGTIRENVFYSAFRKGNVLTKNKNEYKTSRIGEKNLMRTGVVAEIIEYNSNTDVTLRFETGEIRKHVGYKEFLKGTVLPIERSCYYQTRIGEKRTMNNGMEATIVDYISSTNISVRFANGMIKNNVKYQCFMNGQVSPTTRSQYIAEKVGEKRRMNNGHIAEITEYYSATNITVVFEDGIERRNITYSNFKKGNVSNITQREETDLEKDKS